MHRLTFFALFSLFLTACSNQFSTFRVPEKIAFLDETFEKANHSQLDEMQQLLYLPSRSDKNPDNWAIGILIFLDSDKALKSLEERLALRKNYVQMPETQMQIAVVGNELRSEIIYPPSERFQNIQLEATRGRNLACGFGQMQFTYKLPKPKKHESLSKYQPKLQEVAAHFAALPWQIHCE